MAVDSAPQRPSLARRLTDRVRRRWRRRWRPIWWYRWQLRRARRRRIVVGANGRFDRGWIGIERTILDVTSAADWQRIAIPGGLDAILAEHVWEHLTEAHGRLAARLCFEHLAPGGYVRVAVPDGHHPDPAYIEYVRAGDDRGGAHDHKVLFTYRSLAAVFEAAGFEVTLYEYFDEDGAFHFLPWATADGTIRRSSRFDSRNRSQPLTYTSIVIDARKPSTREAAAITP